MYQPVGAFMAPERYPGEADDRYAVRVTQYRKCELVGLGLFFGTIALGAWGGSRFGHQTGTRVLGAAAGGALAFMPAALLAYLGSVGAGCGT